MFTTRNGGNISMHNSFITCTTFSRENFFILHFNITSSVLEFADLDIVERYQGRGQNGHYLIWSYKIGVLGANLKSG